MQDPFWVIVVILLTPHFVPDQVAGGKTHLSFTPVPGSTFVLGLKKKPVPGVSRVAQLVKALNNRVASLNPI